MARAPSGFSRTFHMHRQYPAFLLAHALDHFRRRTPIRPFLFRWKLGVPRQVSSFANADAIAPRGAVFADQIEELVGGIDHDGSGFLRPVKRDFLRQELRIELRVLTIFGLA